MHYHPNDQADDEDVTNTTADSGLVCGRIAVYFPSPLKAPEIVSLGSPRLAAANRADRNILLHIWHTPCPS